MQLKHVLSQKSKVFTQKLNSISQQRKQNKQEPHRKQHVKETES